MKRKSCNLFPCTCGFQRVFNTIHDLRCHETWINKKEDEAAEKSKRLRITMNVRKLISSQIVGQLHYIQFIEGNINYGSKPKSCWIFIVWTQLATTFDIFCFNMQLKFRQRFLPNKYCNANDGLILDIVLRKQAATKLDNSLWKSVLLNED